MTKEQKIEHIYANQQMNAATEWKRLCENERTRPRFKLSCQLGAPINGITYTNEDYEAVLKTIANKVKKGIVTTSSIRGEFRWDMKKQENRGR